MSTLVRTQILLTAEQRRRLHTWSEGTGRTASELIREAIENHFVRRSTPEELENVLRASFGSWKRRKGSSPAIVRGLRRGQRRQRSLA